MDDNQKKIDQLLSRLEILVNQQEHFSKEIDTLRNEINKLNIDATVRPTEKKAQADIIEQKAPEIHRALPDEPKPINVQSGAKSIR